MSEDFAPAVSRALGAAIVATHRLGGGDINEAYACELADGRRVFVKTHPRAPRAMFAREAEGLRWLAEAGALRVPEVLAVSDPDSSGPHFLALELIEPGRRRTDFDAALGRGLAALHRFGAPSFGFVHDNFIGSLPQANGTCSSWAEFYRRRRLEPQLHLATDNHRAPARMRRDFDKLFAVLEQRVGPAEPPARLHGDLWGGNLHCDETGAPCLIDPAVYGGHREIDLAMMRLFGGFGARVFAAYAESFPLAAGHAERVGLYQLYPLMVHVNLFGGSYVNAVQRQLEGLV